MTGRIERGKIKTGEDVEIVGLRDTQKTTCTGVEMSKILVSVKLVILFSICASLSFLFIALSFGKVINFFPIIAHFCFYHYFFGILLFLFTLPITFFL